jgi:hypothetical protein
MFRILRKKKKKKERKTKSLKKTLDPKTREKTKEKNGQEKMKIPTYPALTGRPNCVPMRAERRSILLTSGEYDSRVRSAHSFSSADICSEGNLEICATSSIDLRHGGATKSSQGDLLAHLFFFNQ